MAAGFLVFAIGEGVILSGAALDLAARAPSFGAGSSMWAVALALVSIPRTFPLIVRVLGLGTSILFAVTALQIIAGVPLHPISRPVAGLAAIVLLSRCRRGSIARRAETHGYPKGTRQTLYLRVESSGWSLSDDPPTK